MARREVKKPRIKMGDLDTVTTTDAITHFGDLFHRVVYEHTPVLVEHKGHPMAVLVDIDQYLELMKNPRSGGKKKTLAGPD